MVNFVISKSDPPQMQTTDKLSCNILTDLLRAHGVREVVLSPGSRNTPLIVAMARDSELRCHVVIDERSAAFIALGMSIQSGSPVAIVCTSGTALLNYAPAVAEAFYRRIPLIVISADRPQEWIDQDDSQTIWQQDALAPYVKRSCDISARIDFPNGPWWTDRIINDALIEATTGRKSPVHINVRLDAPLNLTDSYEPGTARVIEAVTPRYELPTPRARELGSRLASPRKVMIIAGFNAPDEKLNRALTRLSMLPNVVVLTETIANLHSPQFINRIDSTLCRMTPDDRDRLRPDVVITFGGALVSRFIKDWLRTLPDLEHWHIGISHTTIDCFKHLSLRVELDPAIFMSQLASAMQPHRAPSTYASEWQVLSARASQIHDAYIAASPWSDMKALAYIFANIPRGWNLHLSNGTPVRYAQLMDCSHIHRSDCNRGVSGIDGCTSTALGASTIYRHTTLLISGDMSFQYDIAALSSTLLTPRFKMIVMVNGGGAIFRFIGSTSGLPELEKYFAVGTRLPLRQLAEAYGMAYFETDSMESLPSAFHDFREESSRPAILAVITDPSVTASTLRGYFQNVQS